jgi:hypothetical protein
MDGIHFDNHKVRKNTDNFSNIRYMIDFSLLLQSNFSFLKR